MFETATAFLMGTIRRFSFAAGILSTVQQLYCGLSTVVQLSPTEKCIVAFCCAATRLTSQIGGCPESTTDKRLSALQLERP